LARTKHESIDVSVVVVSESVAARASSSNGDPSN